MTDERTIAARLLSIVREVHEGGKDIIGERWTLFNKMKELADRGDAVGMIRYFQQCRLSQRGQRVAKRLKDADKKTLESEEERFMGVVADAIVQTKISCLSGVRDAARRRTLANAFEEVGANEDLRVSLGLQRRLRVLPKEGLPRLQALPFIFLRRTDPDFDLIQYYLEQAAICYLLGLFEASAVVGRTAVEVALEARWQAKKARPAPGPRTGEFLRGLIESSVVEKVITMDQKQMALKVKQAGDDAAHGRRLDATRARSSVADLRRLIEALYD